MPKTNVNNAERQNRKNLVNPFPFRFMYANNPPTHPGIHIKNTAHNINSIDIWVHTPNRTHRMKGRMPSSGILVGPIPLFFEKSK